MRTHRQSPTELLHPAVRTVARLFLLLSVVVPLGYMVLLSLSPNIDIAAGTLLPAHIAWGNYVTMWSGTGLGKGIVNSTVICGSASLGGVLLGCIAGYVSSRANFAGRNMFLGLLLGFQSVPTLMVLLPLVIVMAWVQQLLNISVIGTYWAVAIAYMTFALPLVTWFVAAYVDSVPKDLDDAARLDGAGGFQVFWKVILPLIVPAISVAGLLSFLIGWGDLVIATVVSGPGTQTVAVALNSFLSTQEGQTLPQYGPLMAASLVSALPIIVLYLALQRFLVAGLTGSAVKG